jgi:uncharacterized protein involved in outer membrane biogenesis
MNETTGSTSAAPERRRRRRWPWFIAAAILAVVVLAAVVLPLLVDVERHRDRIEQALRETTGWDAELGRIELSVLRGLGLRVSPVNLVAPEGGSRFEAGTVSVRAAVMPLLRGRLEIQSVNLLEPDITLVRPDADRGWILPSIAGSEPARTQGAVSVGQISVSDGALRLEDRSVTPATSFVVEDVDVVLDAAAGEASGSLQALTAAGSSRPVDVEFALSAGDNGWRADRLVLGAGEARINGTGSLLPLSLRLELPPTPIEAALELTEALVPLGLDLSPPGSASATVRIDMPDGGDLSYEAEGELSAARFVAADILPAATDLRTAFRLSREGALDLQILEGAVGGGPLKGTVHIDSVDPPGTLVFDGEVAQASFGALLGGFVDRAPERVTGPAAVSGKVAVDLAAPTLDASSIRGGLALGAGDVSLSGWDLERALLDKLREKLGKLADVAALLDSDAREALRPDSADATDRVKRLLERVVADVDFDALPWTLNQVGLESGGVSARGQGSFDPVAGTLDLRLTAVLDTELTERWAGRYRQLRPLVDPEVQLNLPMRIRGSLVEPELDVDLGALLQGDESEGTLKGLLRGLMERKSPGKEE